MILMPFHWGLGWRLSAEYTLNSNATLWFCALCPPMLMKLQRNSNDLGQESVKNLCPWSTLAPVVCPQKASITSIGQGQRSQPPPLFGQGLPKDPVMETPEKAHLTGRCYRKERLGNLGKHNPTWKCTCKSSRQPHSWRLMGGNSQTTHCFSQPPRKKQQGWQFKAQYTQHFLDFDTSHWKQATGWDVTFPSPLTVLRVSWWFKGWTHVCIFLLGQKLFGQCSSLGKKMAK